ncbi:hypothetical protein LO80_09230 [Candidatus Francisella endociliophora]|uniref:Lipoprotein LPP20-like domain-containing protein n=2 Tax=Candidatus Francisella endociliophora TaxID=653937 RepID=A0A097ERZ7_9GAMM|nr:hypothetical protein LO80_09230 [Francisella sp. FSC1006]
MRFFYCKTLLFILCGIAISSCSTTHEYNPNFTPEVKKVSDKEIMHSTPAWFSSNQSNSENTLYGFGSGDNLGQATKSALSDMVQRLQVTVSTTTSFQNISSNDNISQKLIQQVTTQTAEVNIPNYTVVNQQIPGDTYYIELQINKDQTIHDLQKLILNNTRQAQQLLINAENKSSLDRFNISQKVNNNLKIIKSSLRTLVILSPEIDIEQQMQALNNIDNKLLNLKRTIQIFIDKQNSGFFYDSLEKYLKINNYSLTMQKDYANIYITLKLKDYNNLNKDDKYCIDTKVELQATDNISGELSPKSYTIKACSKQGRISAIDKAVEIFYSQLNNAESIYL